MLTFLKKSKILLKIFLIDISQEESIRADNPLYFLQYCFCRQRCEIEECNVTSYLNVLKKTVNLQCCIWLINVSIKNTLHFILIRKIIIRSPQFLFICSDRWLNGEYFKKFVFFIMWQSE